MTVYFDNAATTKVCPEAAQAVMAALTEDYGNPSSSYLLGRTASAKLRDARQNVASALGSLPEEVLFTSGGTEGDNWALRGGAQYMRHRGNHIITCSSEHDAVRRTAQILQSEGWDVTFINPGKDGRISCDDVISALRDNTVLVSVMLVNNETGAVNPVGDIGKAIHERGSKALLHTDAVQAFLKIPFTPKELGADMVTISSHKIHGPKGCGALYVRKGLHLPPIITGGGQENGLRPGTEAMPAIMGFGAAAKVGKAKFRERSEHIRALRTYVAEELKKTIPDVVLIGEGDAPHILSISMPGYRSEVLMNWLDAAGICVSKSSACKRGARSHVLEAMELPADVVDGAIRISFCSFNTVEEADYFVKTLAEGASRLRKAVR